MPDNISLLHIVLNSYLWYYPCILPLVVNKIGWFKFFVKRKENHFTLFYKGHSMFCKGHSMRNKWHAKKMFARQMLQRKGNGTTSSTIRMLLFWQRNKDNLLKLSRQERSWVINLSIQYIFSFIASLITTFTFHFTLYLIQNK